MIAKPVRNHRWIGKTVARSQNNIFVAQPQGDVPGQHHRVLFTFEGETFHWFRWCTRCWRKMGQYQIALPRQRAGQQFILKPKFSCAARVHI